MEVLVRALIRHEDQSRQPGDQSQWTACGSRTIAPPMRTWGTSLSWTVLVISILATALVVAYGDCPAEVVDSRGLPHFSTILRARSAEQAFCIGGQHYCLPPLWKADRARSSWIDHTKARREDHLSDRVSGNGASQALAPDESQPTRFDRSSSNVLAPQLSASWIQIG